MIALKCYLEYVVIRSRCQLDLPATQMLSSFIVDEPILFANKKVNCIDSIHNPNQKLQFILWLYYNFGISVDYTNENPKTERYWVRRGSDNFEATAQGLQAADACLPSVTWNRVRIYFSFAAWIAAGASLATVVGGNVAFTVREVP